MLAGHCLNVLGIWTLGLDKGWHLAGGKADGLVVDRTQAKGLSNLVQV